jgi:murein DD-endopeptidase MepM/ murein hydrolase activator NlpD
MGGSSNHRSVVREWARTFPLVCVLFASCDSTSGVADVEVCTGYADWQTSEYVLPYSLGTSPRVSQANCSPPGDGHRGMNRYAYDWEMTIGTPILTARAGTVVYVEESHFDGEIAATGKDNQAVVEHADGTVGVYGHLTRDGSLVEVGQAVVAGQRLGSSGNTGNTNNFPHLHFSVHVCNPVRFGSAACPTAPLTFRNTRANPAGLVRGEQYTATP